MTNTLLTIRRVINELFDSSVEYTRTNNNQYNFVAKEHPYVVHFIHVPDGERTIVFGIDQWKVPGKYSTFYKEGPEGILNTKNALQVFSVVINIVKDFVKNNPDVNKLSFTAESRSRIKLYDAMIIKLLDRKLPGWKVKRSEANSYADWVLIRK